MRELIAVALLAVAGLQPGDHADVGGGWILLILDPPLTIDDRVPLALDQDGAHLTGTARDSILGGAVDGRRIGFIYEVRQAQVGRVTLVFTGTVADDGTMAGRVSFGRYGAGTWSAERAE